MATPKYKRILLKLSGEALAKDGSGILDFDFIARVADVLKRCREEGVEIGVIVGAGNIWRGRQGGGMDRKQADHMGMLATAINALALQDSFRQAGLDTVVMSAVEMRAFADTFTVNDANAALANGKVSFTETDLEKCVLKLIKNLSNRDTAFITLIYCEDVSDSDAEKISNAVSAKLGSDIEVTLVNGGQPVYYFIISVE